MKAIILTSSLRGTASHHIPYLLKEKNITVTMVVYSKGIILKKSNFFRRKVKKVLRIGLLGTLNGIRMRKWFDESILKYTTIENLEDVCKKNNIPFYATPSINDENTVALFKKSGADIGLSLENGYISKKVFSIPEYGMLNIHHEMLPEYQNAQGVIWQLYNGSSFTGYTIHKIDTGIDTGAILFRESVPINFEHSLADTVSHTMATLYNKSAQGLVKVLNDYDTFSHSDTPQDKSKSYTTPTIWQYIKIYMQFKKLQRKTA